MHHHEKETFLLLTDKATSAKLLVSAKNLLRVKTTAEGNTELSQIAQGPTLQVTQPLGKIVAALVHAGHAVKDLTTTS